MLAYGENRAITTEFSRFDSEEIYSVLMDQNFIHFLIYSALKRKLKCESKRLHL